MGHNERLVKSYSITDHKRTQASIERERHENATLLRAVRKREEIKGKSGTYALTTNVCWITGEK